MGKAIIQADYKYVDQLEQGFLEASNKLEEQRELTRYLKNKIQKLEEELDFNYEFFKPATQYKYYKAQNGSWYQIDKDDRDWKFGVYFWQIPNRHGLWTKFIEKGEK